MTDSYDGGSIMNSEKSPNDGCRVTSFGEEISLSAGIGTIAALHGTVFSRRGAVGTNVGLLL